MIPSLLGAAFASTITPGNVVVVRVGDGSAALNSAATPVFLDEYTTAGAFVQSIPLPTATSGANRRFTNSGSATSEGFLNLSVDGQYLVHGGYDAAVGTASVAATTSAANPRVIARTDLDGNVDTSTALADAYNAGNVRGVASDDGSQFWTSGTAANPSGSVRYVGSLGATTSTQLSTTITNVRVVTIEAGQLYCSSSTGTFQGVSTVGIGLPTTSGQTIALLPGFPTAAGPSAYDHFFADASTLYVADDRTNGSGGIQKWVLGAGTWTLQYTLSPTPTSGCRGLTGAVASGVATLFATTTQASANQIVTVTDTGAGSTFTIVASAPANTAFRGIRQVPSVCTADTDGDGTPDCTDGCPLDPDKIAPGICGCGISDADTDGDGTPDCTDGCPNDPNKVAPGVCGCGISDADTDGDGTPDCNDGCPLDPDKIAPGICGCGISDADTDGDGTPDCNDGCPNDPNKVAPGVCGCGVSDADSDGDGTPDCNDGCPNDPNKVAPGACGCGIAETDGDGDGLADCIDNCDSVANASQADGDADGAGDACDNCPFHANGAQADCDADEIGDVCAILGGAPDCNGNQVPDACDIASGTSDDQNANAVPDECEQSGGTPFCFGYSGCPCDNDSEKNSQAGCLNSAGTAGKLVGAGSTSVSGDTLSLNVSGLQGPTFTKFFQATARNGVPFGDGKLCITGPIVRLGDQLADANGEASYPASGDLSVSVKGMIPPAGGVRVYQAWYRNVATFCSPETFNTTNGVSVVWQP